MLENIQRALAEWSKYVQVDFALTDRDKRDAKPEFPIRHGSRTAILSRSMDREGRWRIHSIRLTSILNRSREICISIMPRTGRQV